MKKYWFLVCVILFIGALPLRSVYAADAAYENMQEKEEMPSVREEILAYDENSGYVTVDGSRASAMIWDGFWQTYMVVKSILPIIICDSIIIGAIFVMLARKNKGFRRTCIVTFIITIPLLAILYVYGIPSMKSLFQSFG